MSVLRWDVRNTLFINFQATLLGPGLGCRQRQFMSGILPGQAGTSTIPWGHVMQAGHRSQAPQCSGDGLPPLDSLTKARETCDCAAISVYSCAEA